MSSSRPLTILCISSYFKGNKFLETCKEQGARVLLLVREAVLAEPWARQACDEVFALPSLFDEKSMIRSVAYLARTREIDRIAPLDDFDVEMAAMLREHLRIPGMGRTTSHYFRDKLAMRERCQSRGIPVPAFVHLLNDDRIARFLAATPAPWLLKPRSQANSYGIQKFEDAAELRRRIDELGDERSQYLLERYLPGDVCHVDGIVSGGEVLLAEPHRYRRPLMEVAKGGGVFATRTLERDSKEAVELVALHARVVQEFGLRHGVTHMEFIRGAADGELYFLETAARVGGGHIYDVVEAATDINLWAEWAKLEVGQGEQPYTLPPRRHDYAGIVMALARQEQPDTRAFAEPEIVKRIDRAFHIGLVLRAASRARIDALLDDYEPRIARDHMATLAEVAPIR
jgi:biotin carboxylase